MQWCWKMLQDAGPLQACLGPLSAAPHLLIHWPAVELRPLQPAIGEFILDAFAAKKALFQSFSQFLNMKSYTHTNTPWVTSLNLNHNKTPWGSRKLVEIGQEQSRSVLEGPAPATGLTTQLCCFAITVNIATIWASTFKHGCHYRLLFVAITVEVIVSP